MPLFEPRMPLVTELLTLFKVILDLFSRPMNYSLKHDFMTEGDKYDFSVL